MILFRIENRTATISFLTDLRVEGGDEDIRPLFDDNYFALLPGEERDVPVTLRNSTGFVGTKAFRMPPQGVEHERTGGRRGDRMHLWGRP